MLESPILPYETQPAAYRPYDGRFPAVATRVIEILQQAVPNAMIEHFGSTAIPGCAGKGVIDIMLVYPAGDLEAARSAVDGLGFQRWDHPQAFPESRPVRLGGIEHEGARYRIHVHIIEAGQPEIARQLAFRDRLRADPSLVREYERVKQAVIERGITFGPDYAEQKGEFILSVTPEHAK